MTEQNRSGGRYAADDITTEQLGAIAANAVTGAESQRDLAARLGITRPKLQRALKRKDMKVLISEVRGRETERQRGQRRRDADRAEAYGANDATVQAVKTGKPVTNETRTAEPKRTKFKYASFDWNPATGGYENWRGHGFEGGEDDPDFETWLDRPRATFQPDLDVQVILGPEDALSFDNSDDEDRLRAAQEIASARPDLRMNDVLETLAHVPHGRTIEFPPTDAPREPDGEPGVVA